MLLVALSGCASLHTPADRADAQAKAGQFQPVAALADTPVRAWLRLSPASSAASDDGAALTVYIEGDGAEWRGRFEPPADPTRSEEHTSELQSH